MSLTEQEQANLNRISELLAELKPLVENAEKLLAQNTIAQTEWVYVINGGNGSLGADGSTGLIIKKPKDKPKGYGGEEWEQQAELYIDCQNGNIWGLCKGYKTKPVSQKEVELYLTKIAEQRGFKEGSIIYQKGWGGMSNITIGKEPIVFKNNILYCGGWAIWYKGKWASILEPIKEERKYSVFTGSNEGNYEVLVLGIENRDKAHWISYKIKQLLKEL